MTEILGALFIAGLCGALGYILIFRQEFITKYDSGSMISFIYEALPEPWDRRFSIGCGILSIIMSLGVLVLFLFFIRN